jgi:hypothetical protein
MKKIKWLHPPPSFSSALKDYKIRAEKVCVGKGEVCEPHISSVATPLHTKILNLGYIFPTHLFCMRNIQEIGWEEAQVKCY